MTSIMSELKCFSNSHVDFFVKKPSIFAWLPINSLTCCVKNHMHCLFKLIKELPIK